MTTATPDIEPLDVGPVATDTPAATSDDAHSGHRVVALWLIIMAGLIAIMVTIGGATRLTDSGLSITEWDLIEGVLPPLSDAAWEEALEEYRQIPEYQQVNRGMSMEAFKVIFWWEWGHRQMGRFIGLAFLLPLAWFSYKGIVTGGLRWRLWGLFGLICAQGALGWYMVASGLTERVDVSQYRLAAHLGAAFILFGLILWQAMALFHPRGLASSGRPIALFAKVMVGLVFLQTILGAFVAGLRAGKTYNTWPLMDGQFVPEAYFVSNPRFMDLFESIAAVQFNHRIGAYLLLAAAIAFAVMTWRTAAQRYGLLLLAAILLQAAMGIWTVLAAVPLWLGLLHQLGALGVLALAIIAAYEVAAPAGAHRQRGGAPEAPALA